MNDDGEGQHQQQKQKRILLVDDERDIATMLKKGLDKFGFEADIFIDPVVALQDFKPHYYDILLLDLRMPKMSGVELYNRLKQIEGDRNNFKIIFLTAQESAEEDICRLFPEIDMTNFIHKPVGIMELVQRIKEKTS